MKVAIKQFYVDMLNNLKNGTLDFKNSKEILACAKNYFEQHKNILAAQIKAADLTLAENTSLVVFLYEMKKAADKQTTTLPNNVMADLFNQQALLFIDLLDENGYILSSEDIDVIENELEFSKILHLCNATKFGPFRHWHDEYFIAAAKFLALYLKSSRLPFEHFFINKYACSYDENVVNKVLNELTNNTSITPKAIAFYKERYLQNKTFKQLQLFWQINVYKIGWYSIAIKNSLNIILSIYMATPLILFQPIYNKQNILSTTLHEKLLTLLNSFTKNLNLNKEQYQTIIEKQEPVPAVLSVPGHDTGVLFYKNNLIFMNTGDSTDRFHSGITYYQTNEPIKENLAKILSAIKIDGYESIEELENMWLKFEQEKLLTKVYFHYMEEQEVGDCSLRALNYLIPALFTLKLQEELTLPINTHMLTNIKLQCIYYIKRYLCKGTNNYNNFILFKQTCGLAESIWQTMYDYAKITLLENTLAATTLRNEVSGQDIKSVQSESTRKLLSEIKTKKIDYLSFSKQLKNNSNHHELQELATSVENIKKSI